MLMLEILEKYNALHVTIFNEHFTTSNFLNIENGIIVVYCSWSGKAIQNFNQTIQYLAKKKYAEKVFLIDIDHIKTDLQLEIFGKLIHGWGEIFTISHARIIKKCINANSFDQFKNDFESISFLENLQTFTI
jgi:GGDEF domain-containing protein